MWRVCDYGVEGAERVDTKRIVDCRLSLRTVLEEKKPKEAKEAKESKAESAVNALDRDWKCGSVRPSPLLHCSVVRPTFSRTTCAGSVNMIVAVIDVFVTNKNSRGASPSVAPSHSSRAT